MPFDKQDPVTREPHIRNLAIRLFRTVDEDDKDYPEGVEFRLTIDDQFDSPMGHESGDLMPHLPAAIKVDLQSFMDWVWAKANEEVIG